MYICAYISNVRWEPIAYMLPPPYPPFISHFVLVMWTFCQLSDVMQKIIVRRINTSLIDINGWTFDVPHTLEIYVQVKSSFKLITYIVVLGGGRNQNFMTFEI